MVVSLPPSQGLYSSSNEDDGCCIPEPIYTTTVCDVLRKLPTCHAMDSYYMHNEHAAACYCPWGRATKEWRDTNKLEDYGICDSKKTKVSFPLDDLIQHCYSHGRSTEWIKEKGGRKYKRYVTTDIIHLGTAMYLESLHKNTQRAPHNDWPQPRPDQGGQSGAGRREEKSLQERGYRNLRDTSPRLPKRGRCG